jgi:hypothetical protein
MEIKITKRIVLNDEESDIFYKAMLYVRHRLVTITKEKKMNGSKSVCSLSKAEDIISKLKKIYE